MLVFHHNMRELREDLQGMPFYSLFLVLERSGVNLRSDLGRHTRHPNISTWVGLRTAAGAAPRT